MRLQFALFTAIQQILLWVGLWLKQLFGFGASPVVTFYAQGQGNAKTETCPEHGFGTLSAPHGGLLQSLSRGRQLIVYLFYFIVIYLSSNF